MSPTDRRHGTEAGHEQHRRDNEPPCDPCRRADVLASRRRSKRKAMGYVYTVDSAPAVNRLRMWRQGGASGNDISRHVGLSDSRAWELLNDPPLVIYKRTADAILTTEGWPVTPLGITRRVRALSRLGYSAQKIAEAAGVHLDTVIDARRTVREFVALKVRDGILEAYERLSGTIPASNGERDRAGITRTRNHAARAGWLPPLAWDDVDNPHEQPDAGWTEYSKQHGRPRANTIEDFDWLVSQGSSAEQAAAQIGVSLRTVEAYRQQLGKGAAA
jgi:hypothetical protein